MEGEEGGSLNTGNNLLPPVQILDPEAEMDQLPTGFVFLHKGPNFHFYLPFVFDLGQAISKYSRPM